MARIPEEEIERLKREVDLAALIRSKGIELKAHGGKDLVGRCPFHQDDTPSLIVTPAKNLFHCMGCGAGGSAIDFLMKHDGVSFRHAVELLRDGKGQVFGGAAAKKTTVPKLPPPVAFDADDQTLFEQVLDYYRERLKATPAALEYLQSRGITAEAVETFGIGFADRTLGLRLPHKNRRPGQEIRERLQKIGVYRESGHEHFNGCAVFPVRDPEGNVTEIYGRRIGPQKSGIYHLYLPGPHRGLFNERAFQSPEVILTESVIDALTFWVNGLRHVTCIWGTEGFTDDHLEAFKKHRTAKVYLAYDNDAAGNRAAERHASRLGSLGIECYRLKWPPGMDANEYALKVTPAAKSLPILLNGAEWLESGSPQKSEISRNEIADTSSSLAAKLAANAAGVDAARQRGDGEARSNAEGEEHRAPSGRGDEQTPDEAEPGPSAPADAQKEAAKEKKSPGIEVEERGEDWLIHMHDREYRIRGLERNTSFEVLKVNLRLLYPSGGLEEARYYLDTLDFYRAKERERFIAAAAAETTLTPDLVKRDLGKVLLKLEELQEKRIREEMEPKRQAVAIADPDRAAALELLRSPNLLERIVADFEACGIVGEATNKLTGYLAAVSRKLDKPLAVIIQSTSAAGKTSLMEAVLELMPEEERIKYSAMTGQSLYYLGETNLKNKILAIVEEEGAEKASYALKLLQSEGELTIASTGKDENGRMKTEEYHVEGPVMIFLTTTAIDIDEELLNRCMVLTVDESREQTQAIHRLQREAETFDGLKRKVARQRLLTVHRNAQRLLQPLAVVNPYATRLTFLSDRTRTRRDHLKYLTLIRTIALLHQYQRPVKERDGLRYIEASLADIGAANRIAHEVLGRSLDELPPQTRRLLTLLQAKVGERCREKGLDRDQCLFTRRQVREWSGWSNTQVKVHLDRLEDLEWILPRRGTRGSPFEYELFFDGDPQSGGAVLPGLIDAEGLKTHTYDGEFAGSESEFAGPRAKNTAPKRGQNGGVAESSNAPEPARQAVSGPTTPETPENAQGAEKKAV